MKTIDNIEIFGIGHWYPGNGPKSGSKFESADLDAMVESFATFGQKPGFIPPVKLGHEDVQKWFGQKSGAPNLGFISAVKRVGDKVLATLANVPDAIVDLIKQGRYNSVSVELYPSLEYEGKKHRNVLAGIALLGAELPAVKGLADLATALFAEAPPEVTAAGERQTYRSLPVFTQDQVDALIAAAVAKAEAASKSNFESQITALTTERDAAVADATKAKGDLAKFSADVAASEEAGRKAAHAALIEQAVKDGKVLPKARAHVEAFAASLTAKVKFGDKEQTSVEALKEFIDGLAPAVTFGEQGAAGEAKNLPDTGAEVDRRTKALLAKEPKIGYAEAMARVLAEDPALKAKYQAGV